MYFIVYVFRSCRENRTHASDRVGIRPSLSLVTTTTSVSLVNIEEATNSIKLLKY